MSEPPDKRKQRLQAARAELLRRRLQAGAGPPSKDLIPRRAAGTSAPASPAQSRLYFLARLNPDSPAYHMHRAWRLVAPLDGTALERAFAGLIERHAGLRTVFVLREGALEQRVLDTVPFQLEHQPGSTGMAALDGTGLHDLAVQFVNRRFDLERGPLFRAALLGEAEQEQWLVLAVHHIIADEWSLQILHRELAELYRARLQGVDPKLAPLPIDYGDFAAWQQQNLGPIIDQELPFWQERFAILPDAMQLPFDFSRPQRLSGRGQWRQRTLAERLAGQVQEHAGQQGVTPFMLMLAAFLVLLGRHTGQSDLVIGMPAANRARPEFEPLVGLFLNTVVLRAQLDEQSSFNQFLGRVRALALDVYAHQGLPFEELIAALKLEREPNRNPLFQVMLVNEEDAGQAMMPGDFANWQSVPLDSGTAKLDLTVFVRLGGGQLRLAVEYSTDLFMAETVDGLLESFETLLADLLAQADQPLSGARVMSPARQEALLEQAQGPVLPASPPLLPALLAAHAHSSQPALVMDNVTLTYAELEQRVAMLAGRLQQSGAGAGALLPLLLPGGIDQVVAMLACWRVGAAYAPVDVDYPAARREEILHDLARSGRAAGILLTDRTAGTLVPTGWQALRVDEHEPGAPQQPAPHPLQAADLAYVIYTSGSTGLPKGVEIRHGALAASTAARLAYYPTAPGVFLLLSSCSFDSSVAGIFWTLCSGGTLVLASAVQRRDPREIIGLVERHQVSHTLLLPGLWALTLEAAGGAQLSSLREVVVAGEACDAELPARHFRHLPDARLYNEYGPTEATVWSTVHALDEQAGTPIPIGRPIPGAVARVLDQHRRLVPPGVSGELYVGGAGLAAGYLARPDLSAQAFVPDPLAPGQRLYRTGDQVRLDHEGRLLFLGRVDQQIKLRGHRIEPGEIEARLRALPRVGDAHVGLDPHSRHPRLLAWVSPVPERPEQLRQDLRRQLPEYMVPAAIVGVSTWPLGPNGKLDVQALPSPLVQAQPDAQPLDKDLQPLAAIWERVLGVPVQDAQADFFALGGQSLSGVSLVLEIERVLGVSLPLAALFEAPSLAALHERIGREREAGELRALIALRETGSQAPLFCVQSRARSFARYLGAEQPLYLLFESTDSEHWADATVESLAERYLAELRNQRPNGPYRLMGFSVGAQIALEMALQLTAMGETVEFLVLVDPPLSDAGLFYRQRAQLAREQISRQRGLSGKLGAFVALARQAVSLRVRRMRLRAVGFFFDATRNARQGLLAALRNRLSVPEELLLFRLSQRYRQLYERYRPRPYAGDTLVLLNEGEAPNRVETARYWDQYLTGRHQLLLVRGAQSHVEMLADTCTESISAEITALAAGHWPAADRIFAGAADSQRRPVQ